MDLICSVDKNWNLGRDNDLLFYIREDMARFRRMTLGQTVVMGRRTLESLPGGQPLEGRKNIVISSTKTYACDKITSYRSVEDFLLGLDQLAGRVYLIGGGRLIDQLLAYCQFAYITKVDQLVEEAQVAMEDLDKNPDFRLVEEGPSYRQGSLSYKYVKYENINRKRV